MGIEEGGSGSDDDDDEESDSARRAEKKSAQQQKKQDGPFFCMRELLHHFSHETVCIESSVGSAAQLKWHPGRSSEDSTREIEDDQDFYETLGLGHLRYKATQDEIKEACFVPLC